MADTPTAKVAVVAKLLVQPGKLDEAVAVLGRLIDAANGEAGTEMYVLHTAKDDPEAVWFYELYTDDEALGAHSTSPAMSAVFGDLGPLLGGPPELHVLSPVSGKGLGT
jgi:quinol monooxygenase YgiN